MDLQPRVTLDETLVDKEWLGSDHGLDCPRSITLDIANGGFTIGADRMIADGTGLVYDSGSKMYRAAPDGTTRVQGHLLESVRVPSGATKVGAALLWHGVVILARVPNRVGGAFGSGNTAAANILYI